MKQILTVVAFLILTPAARADRALYTSECVEYATVIGVWKPGDLVRSGNDVRLGRSDTLLKGDARSLDNVKKYSSRLTSAIKSISQDETLSTRDRSLIFFIRVDGETADLVEFTMPYSHLAVKAVTTVIAQLELQRKWNTLSVDDQIEQSDLIVVGKITTGEEVCPMTYELVVDKRYRGVSIENLEVLPVAKAQVNVDALVFIQRHAGDGADYIVMNVVPVKEATAYFEKLNELKLSRSAIKGEGRKVGQ